MEAEKEMGGGRKWSGEWKRRKSRTKKKGEKRGREADWKGMSREWQR